MRGRYLIRNPKAAAGLTAIDAMLSPLRWAAKSAPTAMRRILVCNWAHIGDVILILPFLRELRRRYPQSVIDVLAGSWTRSVLVSSQLADNLVIIDHWMLNRSNLSKLEKWRLYKRQSLSAISGLRAAKYDVAIDLYQHHPNAAFELRAAGIPYRIGYDSGGFGPFYSRTVPWRIDGRHVSEHHFEMFDLLPGSDASPEAARAFYPPPSEAALAEIAALNLPQDYALIHPGAGLAFREWPEEKWIDLLAQLRARGTCIVLAGAGERERLRAGRLSAAAPDIINLCDKLPWPSFVAVMSRASYVVCLDSMSGHVAAGLGVPAVSILSGSVDPREWGPLNPRAEFVSHSVPCAPCNRAGCDEMACVREVTPAEVLRAIEKLI